MSVTRDVVKYILTYKYIITTALERCLSCRKLKARRKKGIGAHIVCLRVQGHSTAAILGGAQKKGYKGSSGSPAPAAAWRC